LISIVAPPDSSLESDLTVGSDSLFGGISVFDASTEQPETKSAKEIERLYEIQAGLIFT
jgi:hypothetical protein